MNNCISELDTSWVENYIKEDTEKDLIKSIDIDTIKVFFVYINSNHIQNIKHIDFELDKTNILSKEELLGLIKKYSINNSIKYSYYSTLIYNISLESSEVENYIDLDDEKDTEENFLKSTSSINDINLKPCIHFFHDLNTIIILFKTINTSQNITKKIYIKSSKSKKKQTRKRT